MLILFQKAKCTKWFWLNAHNLTCTADVGIYILVEELNLLDPGILAQILPYTLIYIFVFFARL